MQQYRKNLGKVSLTAEGVWDIKSKYDVLSIVYDEHTQHGFISKQPVPIGVDLYNSEYWMPLNVSGYTDSNIIILNKKTSDASIETYTLEEAIKSIADVGRKPGCILGFYNSNVNRLDIGGRWEIWQFNSTTISEWEDLSNWQNIYYNYNQFVGWYRNEEQLKVNNPYPEIGCYAYVGNVLNEAVVYRCEIKHKWTETVQRAWDYVKVMINGTVTVGENGNWFNDGMDTGIPASIKGEPGNTPFIRYNSNSNKLEYSYNKEVWHETSDYISTWFRLNNNKLEMSRDNANWNPVSDYIAAWFRWQATAGDTQANNVGRIQMSRDNGKTWTNMSNDFTNNLHISRYIGINESLPTSGIAEGTIYAKGPTYHADDTNFDNPIYRLWVYAWKDNTLAWQDNGEFQSIAAGVVQEIGNSETEVMSQKAVTERLTNSDSYLTIFNKDVVKHNPGYDYSLEVSELYINANLTVASFWVLADATPILWFKGDLGCKFDFAANPNIIRENNIIYPLSVYYGATEEYPIGTILGYVVFNDIYKAASHAQSYAIYNINYNYCNNIKNSPLIASFLNKSIYKNSITSEKIAPKSITSEKIDEKAVRENQLANGKFLFPLKSLTLAEPDYSVDIQELYILSYLQYATNIRFWYNDSAGLVLFFDINGITYGAKNENILYYNLKNNVVYPLTLYYGDFSIIQENSIIAYVVFKNIDNLKTKIVGDISPNVNYEYCSNIKNSPQVAKYLKYYINEYVSTFNDIINYTDYSNAVSEILILNQENLSKIVTGVGFWMYAYSPILWFKTKNGDIGCKYEEIVSQNNVAYPLKVYYGATEEYPNGTILGYVLFKDVKFATSHDEGNYAPNINMTYCTIKNCPQIAKAINYYGASQAIENIPNLRLPNKIYAVVGDTLQLYYRAILDVWNIKDYKIRCICDYGKSYPRYFEFTPTSENIGTTSLTIQVINQIGKIITSATTTLQIVSKGNNPSFNKNIFIFGDSLTGGGQWPAEMHRRLIGNDGNPVGDGKSNITFCGSMGSRGANYFGVGGWSWTDYITKGRGGFRFFVTGVSSISIGTNYTNNGHTYIVTEVNVTNGEGNIRCDASFASIPTSSGVLTKTAGTGDNTITFTSYSEDSQNPLWDDTNGEFTFIPYVNKYGNGQCDVVYTLLTWNSLPQNSLETINEESFNNIRGYVKTFADKLHEEFPDAKLKLIGLQCPSLDGGYTSNYGAGYQTWALDFHGLKCAFYMNKMLQTFANSEGYSDFVEFVDAGFQFDDEYGEQYTMKPVHPRLPNVTEKIGTNGVHPSDVGYMMFADAAYRNFVANFCQ